MNPDARPARHRERSLLTDTERAMFLQQWAAIQTGFVASPDGTADAAEHLVNDVARRIVQNIGAVRDQALRPVDGAVPAPATGDPAEAGDGEAAGAAAPVPRGFQPADRLLTDCGSAADRLLTDR